MHLIANASCAWRIVISPVLPQDSPSCYDSAMGNLVVLFTLWFVKASAETQDGAVLGGVSLNLIIASIEQEDPGGHQPKFAGSAHIIKGLAKSRSGPGRSIVTLVQR